MSDFTNLASSWSWSRALPTGCWGMDKTVAKHVRLDNKYMFWNIKLSNNHSPHLSLTIYSSGTVIIKQVSFQEWINKNHWTCWSTMFPDTQDLTNTDADCNRLVTLGPWTPIPHTWSQWSQPYHVLTCVTIIAVAGFLTFYQRQSTNDWKNKFIL